MSNLHRPTRRQARILLLVVLAGIVLSVITERLLTLFVEVDVDQIRTWVESTGSLAPLTFMALMVAAIVFAPIPSVPLDIAAGVMFGWALGVVYVLVGATIGGVVAMLLGRALGRSWVERRIPAEQLAAINDGVERQGAWAVFFMRLLPAFQFDWISYAAGVTRMRVAPFAIATFAGMVPPVVAIVAVGDQLEANPARAATIFAVLALVTALPLVYWAIVPPRDRSAT